MPSLIRGWPPQADLDHLYANDRSAWRQEMRDRLEKREQGMLPKHLALSMETFNTPEDKTLCLESVWQYLDTRKGRGPSLTSQPDRELLAFYAESTMRTTDRKLMNRLNELCLTLKQEQICRGN